jgi:hypothetical protein
MDDLLDRDGKKLASFGSYFGILNCSELRPASVTDVARNALQNQVNFQINTIPLFFVALMLETWNMIMRSKFARCLGHDRTTKQTIIVASHPCHMKSLEHLSKLCSFEIYNQCVSWFHFCDSFALHLARCMRQFQRIGILFYSLTNAHQTTQICCLRLLGPTRALEVSSARALGVTEQLCSLRWQLSLSLFM